MGDIYHAGEVYAGSVPIDDTQASEDKVYSSEKVETMIEEVQSDSGVLTDKITAGTGVTINTQKIRKKGNVVNLYILVTTPQSAADLTIGTIDSAYRPSFNQSLVGMAHTGDSGQKECQIDINTNGRIVSHYHTTYKYIFFSATYLTS